MKNLKNFVILFPFVLLSFSSDAQSNELNTSFYIQTLFNTLSQALDISINASDYKTKKVSELEFRSETKDVNFSQLEHQMRLSWTTKKERETQMKIANLYADQQELVPQEFVGSNVSDALKNWVNLSFLYQKRNLYMKLDSLYLFEQNMFNGELLNQNMSSDNYIKLKIEHLACNAELNKISFAIDEQLVLLGLSITIQNFKDLISIDELPKKIGALSKLTSSSDQLEKIKLNIDHQKIMLEEIQSKKILRFTQISYQHPSEQNIGQNISVGLSFIVPQKLNTNLKLYELKAENNIDFMDQQQSVSEKVNINKQLIFDFKNAFQGIKIDTESLKEQKIVINNYAQSLKSSSAEIDFTKLTSMQQDLVKKDLKLVDKQQNLYFKYIELMNSHDAISTIENASYFMLK